jgi:hypothetical protein
LPRIPPEVALHRRRVLPRSRHQRVPRPTPSCGQPGLRGAGIWRLPTDSRGARPRLVHPEEVISEQVRRDMTGGHDRLIRLALAHVGLLP